MVERLAQRDHTSLKKIINMQFKAHYIPLVPQFGKNEYWDIVEADSLNEAIQKCTHRINRGFILSTIKQEFL